jgi:hypothetical protein
MSEVIRVIGEPVMYQRAYRAQVCGRLREDDLWEGWVEFVPVDGGSPVCSPRETTQPNLDALSYWAAGLSRVYLEGALQRGLEPRVAPVEPLAFPIFDSPLRD